jgi:hypothetical protein
MEWALVLAIGVVAGVVGGVVGFGASLMLMPVLVFVFGAKETVPIMALAALIANLARALVWWREIDWRLVATYAAAAVPMAALGASLLITLDARVVEAALGAFFLLMIPIRRWLLAHGIRITLPGMAVVGAGIGFITGLVAATGPINTPFFLAYGLTKGAFLATEALGSTAISLTKLVVFRTAGALDVATVTRGLAVGASLMVGTWVSKRLVLAMDASQFRVAIEVMMALAGLAMIASALR